MRYQQRGFIRETQDGVSGEDLVIGQCEEQLRALNRVDVLARTRVAVRLYLASLSGKS